MSANNVIYVQKQGNDYFVWHTDIDYQRDANADDRVEVSSLEEALNVAYRMANDYGVVEYGIQVLPSINQI